MALHREESAIYTANLGDSGFRVVRAGKIVHRSQEQQHYFNTPFQLAVAPSDMQGLVLSDRSAAVSVLNLAFTVSDLHITKAMQWESHLSGRESVLAKTCMIYW